MHQLTYNHPFKKSLSIIIEKVHHQKSFFFWRLQLKIKSNLQLTNYYLIVWSHGSSWKCTWLPTSIDLTYPSLLPTCFSIPYLHCIYTHTHFFSTHSTYVHICVYIHKVSEVRFSLSVTKLSHQLINGQVRGSEGSWSWEFCGRTAHET